MHVVLALHGSKSVALVEFGTAVDARRAFKRLAYTRYQHVPLYLEWAPLGIFKEGAPKSKQALPTGEHAVGAIAGVSADGSAAATDAAAADEDQDANASTANTVYVKNLAWATTEDGLRRCFEAIGAIRAVAIPRKKPPAGSAAAKDAPPGGLSMGFGFVEFAAAASAKTAVATLQGTILDGHALELKHSTKRLAPVPKQIGVGVGGKKRSKLIARNVAFQATARELRELFGAYGQLQRVRMPKKFDGSHRGFAFIDFATAQEASNAFQALASTHLYGRHLVLEWAEEDSEGGDVSALREKAAKDVRGALAAKAGKRRKLDEDGGFGDGGGDFD
ncbi:hypothetical protein JKP88DRAFT_347588 [Tribonema minus]|uniref:RRM domain-containing protein n=1 Tax=Tribonema minus TaxID=303371 RepID=A0A835ZB66_9STRA|nr:hypothetical protein JKP88DRAFT_347588 [Tribonema minus]